VNKFEALAQFQGWPRDWQRLCAEYWIEMGDVDPKAEKTSFGSWLTMTKDPWPLDQPETEKAEKKQAKKPHVVNSRESTGFTLDELRYAQNGIALGIKDCLLAEDMGRRYGRTKKAFQNYISLIHRNGIDLSTGRKKPHGVQY